MSTHTFVKNLNVGEMIENVTYIIQGGSNGETKFGKPYTFLEVGDITGTIIIKIWDSDKEISDLVTNNIGDYIKIISGAITEYGGQKEISPENMMVIFKEDKEQYGIVDDNYIKQPKVSVDNMFKEIVNTIKEIENEDISTIMKVAMNRYYKDFKEGVGAKSMHHNYVHGLLTHTYTMLQLAKNIVSIYGDEHVNTDVLYGGLILHDIGKIVEYQNDNGNINVTTRGMLMGHISIGHEIIANICKERDIDLDDEKNLHVQGLIHLILSHHGKREWGSPVTPQTVEAHILHQVDMIDSRMDVITNTLDSLSVGEISKPIYMLDNSRLLKLK